MIDTRNRHRPLQILVVDDNPGDVQLVIEALKDATHSTCVQTVSDGMAALAFLRQESPYQAVLRPDLVLLDLNLPKKNGRTVLTEIRADPNLRTIFVVIFTTAQAEATSIMAAGLNVNGAFVKPIDFSHFVTTIQAIVDCWGASMTRPPNAGT